MCFISYLFKYFSRIRFNTKILLTDTLFSSVRETEVISDSIAALEVIVRRATVFPPFFPSLPSSSSLSLSRLYRHLSKTDCSSHLCSPALLYVGVVSASFSAIVTVAADLLTRSVFFFVLFKQTHAWPQIFLRTIIFLLVPGKKHVF